VVKSFIRDVNKVKAANPRPRPYMYKTKVLLPMSRPIVKPKVVIEVN